MTLILIGRTFLFEISLFLTIIFFQYVRTYSSEGRRFCIGYYTKKKKKTIMIIGKEKKFRTSLLPHIFRLHTWNITLLLTGIFDTLQIDLLDFKHIFFIFRSIYVHFWGNFIYPKLYEKVGVFIICFTNLFEKKKNVLDGIKLLLSNWYWNLYFVRLRFQSVK